MTDQEFTDLYSNGFARTVKEFLKYFDQEDAEEYAQEVYARIWQYKDSWDRTFSIVLFWHLHLRKVISDALKKKGDNIELRMFDGEDNVEEFTGEADLGALQLIQKIIEVMPSHLYDYAWYRAIGHGDRAATQLVNDKYNNNFGRDAYRVALSRFIRTNPQLTLQFEELYTEE